MQLNFCQGNCQSLRDELSMKDEKLRTAHKEFHFDQELNRKLVVWLKQCLTRQENELSRLNKVNRYLQGKMRVYYQPSGSPMKGDANRRLRLHLSFRSSELEEVGFARSRTRKNKNEGGGRGSAIATHMKLEKTKAHSMADKEIQVAFRNEKAEFGQPMQGIDKNNPSDDNKRHLKDTDEPTKCCNDVHTQTQPISNELWTELFKNLKSENDGFTSEIQNLKKITRRLETQLEEKERELNTQAEQRECLQRQLDSEKRDKGFCQASVEASVRQEAAQRVQLERQIEQLSNTVRERQLELNTARERSTEQTKQLERQTQCVEQLKKEKTELLNRLSKLASSALTDGNPAIADLSDEKRPTKLAEIYSELYDNEWTEAFDEQEKRFNRKEIDIIEDLLYLLMKTHQTCHSVSVQYLERMTDAASQYQEEDTMFFKCGAGGNAPVEVRKMIRDIRNVASPYIQLKIKQALDNEWKQRKVRVEKSTQAYIDKCLQLCWDMSVKDPPVVLTSLPAVGSDYKKDKYRFYTESGSTVGYTVWPGMLLHEGGPTLVKGVVQGMELT